MLEKTEARLRELSGEFSTNNFLEFLELYGILLTETRNYEALEGIQTLKEFMRGVKEGKTSGK